MTAGRHVFAVSLAAAILAGCVTTSSPVSVNLAADSVVVGARFDADAFIVMTPAVRAYVYSGTPQSLVGSAVTLTLPLGEGLDQAARAVYGKAFRSAKIVPDASQVPSGALAIQPSVRDFSWRSSFGADTGTTTVHVRAGIGDRVVLDREYRMSAGAPMGDVAGYNLGSAAGKMMVDSLARSVEDLVQIPDVAALAGAAAPVPQAAAAPPAPPPVGETKFPARAERPDDVAVIIGNAGYARYARDIPDVTPAHADAAAVRAFATRALGIREGNVIFLMDATATQLIEVFGNERDHRGRLFNWVKPGHSRVFVYYSGHGAPGGAEGRQMLVPVDASASQLGLSGYPLDTLYANLAKLPVESVTVVLEACFSGVSQAGAVIASASPVFIRPKEVRPTGNLTVISAGGADQIASWAPDKSNGLFTKYFLMAQAGEADRKPYGDGDGKVELDEVRRYLDDTLTYYARRHYGRDQKAQIVEGGKRP